MDSDRQQVEEAREGAGGLFTSPGAPWLSCCKRAALQQGRRMFYNAVARERRSESESESGRANVEVKAVGEPGCESK